MGAYAHGDDEPTTALALIRQAIALIVNTPDDTEMIADKINDAVESDDTAGVQTDVVGQAKQALDAGDLHKTRALLEQSIGARVHTGDTDPVVIGQVPPPAAGAETATLAAIDPLPSRSGLRGGEWALLIVCLFVAAAGPGSVIPAAAPTPYTPHTRRRAMTSTPDISPADVTQGRQPWTRRFMAAVDERLGIDAVRYPVPAHANRLAYSLGGLTAVSFLILVVTGVILGQYYNPDPSAANESVRHIVETVYLGRFTRGLHYWAAEAMYVLAILHLLRIYFTASYKRPREANWLIGVAMFALIIGALFTGTVLKWDQEGFEALGHNLEVAKILGGFGFWFNSGFSPAVPLLVRLHVAHVSMIPGLILVLFVVHALLVKRHKISPTPGDPEHVDEPLAPFTHHLGRVLALGLVLLGGLGVLAVLFPPGVGPTPVEGIEVTKPPWMYWWMFTLENWIGLSGILWGAGILFGLLVLVPFVDRGPERRWRERPVAITLGAVVLAVIIVLTILEAVTSPAEHLGGM